MTLKPDETDQTRGHRALHHNTEIGHPLLVRSRGLIVRRVLLGVVAVAATAIAVKFGVRYGDFYKIGDSEYRRTGTGDALRIVVPSVVAAVAVIALLLSRLMPHGLRSEFSDEIEELRQARKWSSERRAAR